MLTNCLHYDQVLPFKLYKYHFFCLQQRNFFPNAWNNMPPWIVESSSLNFKANLDAYWTDNTPRNNSRPKGTKANELTFKTICKQDA